MERNSSSSAEMLRLPDHLDTPTFTCEVCKISVRSAQKLMDHVNFSPLHQASLGLGKGSNSGDGGKSRHMRRLLYDGSKLFWRVNETLDLCIYEDMTANCVTIRAFPQNTPQSSESDSKTSASNSIPALDVDSRLLRQTLGLEAAPKVSGLFGRMAYPPVNTMSSTTLANKAKAATATPEHSGELITKYLLARLQARRDAHDRVNLILQMINDDEVDPADLLLATTEGSQGLPTDLAIRRRHTIDDVKEAQKEVSVAATRLKNARMKAEELSNLARMTLDAFSRSTDRVETRMVTRAQAKVATLASSASNTILGLDGGRRFSVMSNKPAATWMRAYDRVVLQNAVERSKEVIDHLPHYEEKMGPIEESK
ncbi:trna (cytosine-5-)-methyltransferase [Phytophthora cinnamomi]|uniref:trna (cytosine-5-)-methyltransferase n=1 Tax=Phytophthora cinnamomi TaxID=4785 RepID=UPI00355A9952|nr:trna (cytosine-5-)-methyltransferase [Phytophthora cinnamomi]